MKYKILILATACSLASACSTPPPKSPQPSLSEKLVGKSPEERKEIL